MSVPTECFLVLVLVLILILILILCVRHVQWFCGAPVVEPPPDIACRDVPSTSSRNLGSLDTTVAVRWCDILSSASSTSRTRKPLFD